MIEMRKTDITKRNPASDPPAVPGLEPIDALAEEYLSRIRAGESPDIESYAQEHPELAGEIRELFPTLAMLEKYGAEEPQTLPPAALAAFEDVPPELGEYQIQGEIGRGGMGVVYDAIHRTIQRRVALKVLPREKMAQRKNVERFLRETRAAGNLHHTNIVPVFEAGVDQGVYFYSMQYIHGQNLDAVIEELRGRREDEEMASDSSAVTRVREGIGARRAGRHTVAESLLSGAWHSYEGGTTKLVESGSISMAPVPADDLQAERQPATVAKRPVKVPKSSEFAEVGEAGEGYFRRVARVGLQVAEALEYAHNQGVLHRDIKPSNLLLDTHGVVWVTDFGLAKSEGDDFTHSGDIVGTLRYMAPERFRGQTDARSDLYSLGLTLYELCTFRYAFEQSDRAELIHHVTHQTPPAPRAVNPHIPRDLETIILKSIDKDPAHRYQSADDLADDLRLFVHDHPINARRASLSERAWRWCRRNPSQALLTASVAILLLVLAGVSLYSAYDSAKQAEALKTETLRALEAEAEAQNAKRVAINALYETHLGRAHAGRWSQRPGQHFSSLDALTEAAKILPTLGLRKAERKQEILHLRNEAIAAMPLVDVRVKKSWAVKPGWTGIVAFSQNYDLYAHSDNKGNIAIHRVLDDRAIQRLTGPGAQAWLLEFSPDGRFLAAKFHDEQTTPVLWVWELATGRVVLECGSKTVVPMTMAFSPDGTQLAVAGRDYKLRIYAFPQVEIVLERQFDEDIKDVCFDPTGTQMAVATARGGYVLRLSPAEAPAASKGPKASPDVVTLEPAGALGSIAWSGDYISGGAFDGPIKVWESHGFRKPIHVLEGHLTRVVRLNASHNGNLLFSYSWDGTSRMWDLQRGREVLRSDVQSQVRSAFSPDDRRIGFSGNGQTFGIWEVALGGPLRSVGRKGGNNTRWMLQFHPKRPEVAAVASNRGVQFWNIETGEQVGDVPAGYTQAVLFPPDGESILTSGAIGLCQWPIEFDPDQPDQIQIGPKTVLLAGACGRASIDKAGRYVAVDSGYRHAFVLDLENPGKKTVLSPHGNIDRAVISPDGRRVVTATWQGKGVRVWDRKTGTMLINLISDIGSATPAFSPDGRWLAVASADAHFIYDAATWSCKHQIPRDQLDDWPGDVAFSPDSKLVAFNDTRYSTQLVDVFTGERVAILEPPERKMLGWRTFSADGRRLAITEDDHIQIWDWQSVTKRLEEMNLD